MIIKKVTPDTVNEKEVKTSKSGKKYQQVGVKVSGGWYNGIFFGKDIDKINNLKSGKPVTLVFFQEEYQGKMYAKFKFPSRLDLLEARIEEIERCLKK